MCVRVRKVETEIELPIGLDRSDRLHREPLLAEIEDHAAGHAVETGENRAVHFMAQTGASFWEHPSASKPHDAPYSRKGILSPASGTDSVCRPRRRACGDCRLLDDRRKCTEWEVHGRVRGLQGGNVSK